MRILHKDEKILYDMFMSSIPIEKIDCWELKAPDDFENHTPLKEFTDDL